MGSASCDAIGNPAFSRVCAVLWSLRRADRASGSHDELRPRMLKRNVASRLPPLARSAAISDRRGATRCTTLTLDAPAHSEANMPADRTKGVSARAPTIGAGIGVFQHLDHAQTETAGGRVVAGGRLQGGVSRPPVRPPALKGALRDLAGGAAEQVSGTGGGCPLLVVPILRTFSARKSTDEWPLNLLSVF